MIPSSIPGYQTYGKLVPGGSHTSSLAHEQGWINAGCFAYSYYNVLCKDNANRPKDKAKSKKDWFQGKNTDKTNPFLPFICQDK